ncbi:Fc.00g009660.m01.CDS01 [Cosmosporella sp. VM-42]
MNSYDVLVTGSSGHLGTALMLSLPSMGFNPVGVDILKSPHGTTHHTGSIANREFVRSILQSNPIRYVLHAATLHKPHVGSHTKEDFIETNIKGTLVLLEEASNLGEQMEGFIFFSTTSAFGAALSPGRGSPAVWITESVAPIPKNIYGITKVAAEDMCYLVHKQTNMPTLVLRTSRFFPEQDDDEDRRAELVDDNLKVMELAYRRCDMEDIVNAAVRAMKKAKYISFSKYIISAPTPFINDAKTLRLLDENPGAVYEAAVPASAQVFKDRNWNFLARIDRVYDSSKAVNELGWEPKYTFEKVIEFLAEGKEWRSDLSKTVGKLGYHSSTTGVYTIR